MRNAPVFWKIASAPIVLCCLLFIATPAHAQIGTVAMAELYVSIMDACEGWLAKAGEIALQLLAVTAIIGFAIGIKDLVLSGHLTMDGIVALFVRYAFIVGLLVWLLSTPQKLALIPLSIKKIGSAISGQDISFGGLIDLFSKVAAPLVDFTTGLGWTDVGLIICMTFIIFMINCLFFLIVSTVLVVEVESVFILIGGLFTASFFVIGYFRDSFLGYIKALAAVGVKMLMLCLCLGAVRKIMSGWPDMIASRLGSGESVFSFLTPMACALLGFYMILKAVPQFASSVMTGSVSGMDGGSIRAAAAAGYGIGMSVWNKSRTVAQNAIGAAGTLSQAAQSYSYTAQAARDTGSSAGEARKAGAWEAFKTVMTGPQAGGPRTAGDRMYADSQRAAQYADVRGSGDMSDSLSKPAPSAMSSSVDGDSSPDSSSSSSASPDTQNSDYENREGSTSAGPYVSPSPQSPGFEPAVNSGRTAAINASQSGARAKEAVRARDALEGTNYWGAYASDTKEEKGRNGL